MALVMFDTHQFIQTLQASGFEQKQAEAVSNDVSSSTRTS